MLLAAIQYALMNGKTATGAIIYLVDYYLRRKGIVIPHAQLVATITMAIGIAHKFIKTVPWPAKIQALLVKLKLV